MRVAKRVKNEGGQWVLDGHIDLPEEWDGFLVPGTRAISEAEVSVINNAIEEHGSIEDAIKAFNIREGSTIPWMVQQIMKVRNQARHEKMVGQEATEDQDGYFDRLFAGLTEEHKALFASESPRKWMRVQRACTSLDRADVSMGIDAIREFNLKHSQDNEVLVVQPEDGNSDVLDVKDGEEPF